MTYDLKELFKGIDARPFTGEKELTPTVVCKGEEFPDSWFSPSSMLGATRDEYYPLERNTLPLKLKGMVMF